MYKVGDKVAFIWDNKFYSGKVQSIDKNLNVFNIPYYRIKECPDPIRADMIIPSPIAKIQAEINLYNEGIESETEFPNEGSDFNIVEYQAKIEFGYEVLKILGSDE